MLYALVDRIDDVAPGARVVSLSTFPTDDRAVNTKDRLEIGSLTPRQIIVPVLPLAVLIWMVRKLGGSGRWLAGAHPSLSAILKADVVADLAGISFVDGRGVPTLGYNILMTGIPLLLGTPVVKCSQALGPFRERFNRLAAKLVLPRLSRVVARGQQTERHLADLGLTNAVPGADFAFLMTVDDKAVARARSFVPDGPYVVVSPSSVVRSLATRAGVDYVDMVSEVIDRIVEETGSEVVVIAHSARPGHHEGRLNDIPVCTEVVQRASRSESITLLADAFDPDVLRAIIGGASVVVTSRFHAMISALATTTPVLVVGWSHKYLEVMGEFGMSEFVIDYAESGADGIVSAVESLLRDRPSHVSRIADSLPAVEESATASVTALREVFFG